MKTILQIRQDFGLHICGVCIYMYLLQESCFPRMQKRETIEREKSGSFWCVYIYTRSENKVRLTRLNDFEGKEACVVFR